MKKLALKIILSLLLLFLSFRPAFAITDPLVVPNNRYGIHIFSEKDLEDAARLVNSTNGDWGYITLVITEGERDHDRWQKVFDQMRRLHLIPIVRIATKAEGGNWKKPQVEEINNWTAFLNSLNWVIENRYIVIGNEPNHAAEWGGEISPGDYATYLGTFSAKLKEASGDFFVLPAGLDSSATNTRGTMDEAKFLREMIKKEPDVFDHVDGFTSHSYPNPDFSGSETETGRGTVAGFTWEKTYLESLNISKDFPIFVTETGWSNTSLGEEEIGKRLAYSFENVWNAGRIVAVTPFILNYPQAPFNVFSWEKDGHFYSFYDKVKSLIKTKGEPVQKESGEIVGAFAQPIILSGSDFVGAILARNTGQTIWNANEVSLGTDSKNMLVRSYSFNEIEPMRLGLIIFKSSQGQKPGLYQSSVFLKGKKGQRITNTFPLEGVIIKFDKVQISRFLGTIGGYFTGR